MKKKIKIDLPLEVGKVYQTKFQTGERFKLTQDPYRRDKDGNIVGVSNTVWGIYEHNPELGVCPLPIDRLIPETEFTGEEIEVCDNCGYELGATVAPETKIHE